MTSQTIISDRQAWPAAIVVLRAVMLALTYVITLLQNAAMDNQLRALANPTRRKILRLVSAGERSAGHIASHFHQTRPAISQHLSQLCDAGLLKVRRCAQSRLYSIDENTVGTLQVRMNEFWEEALPRLKETIEADLNRQGNKKNE